MSKSSVAVVPLAIPLLAGPGAISTVIIAMHRSNAEFHWLLVIGCILVVSAMLWVVLRVASRISNMLGTLGLNIINRLFGLILAAIAIEIMANGMKQLFPGLN
jgi:multiple antibiotic resistance protein